MADLRGLDANQLIPTTYLEAIPAGGYLAMIAQSEMKPNKTGTDGYLDLVFAPG